jgi:hypothetical protein
MKIKKIWLLAFASIAVWATLDDKSATKPIINVLVGKIQPYFNPSETYPYVICKSPEILVDSTPCHSANQSTQRRKANLSVKFSRAIAK